MPNRASLSKNIAAKQRRLRREDQATSAAQNDPHSPVIDAASVQSERDQSLETDTSDMSVGTSAQSDQHLDGIDATTTDDPEFKSHREQVPETVLKIRAENEKAKASKHTAHPWVLGMASAMAAPQQQHQQASPKFAGSGGSTTAADTYHKHTPTSDVERGQTVTSTKTAMEALVLGTVVSGENAGEAAQSGNNIEGHTPAPEAQNMGNSYESARPRLRQSLDTFSGGFINLPGLGEPDSTMESESTPPKSSIQPDRAGEHDTRALSSPDVQGVIEHSQVTDTGVDEENVQMGNSSHPQHHHREQPAEATQSGADGQGLVDHPLGMDVDGTERIGGEEDSRNDNASKASDDSSDGGEVIQALQNPLAVEVPEPVAPSNEREHGVKVQEQLKDRKILPMRRKRIQNTPQLEIPTVTASGVPKLVVEHHPDPFATPVPPFSNFIKPDLEFSSFIGPVISGNSTEQTPRVFTFKEHGPVSQENYGRGSSQAASSWSPTANHPSGLTTAETVIEEHVPKMILEDVNILTEDAASPEIVIQELVPKTILKDTDVVTERSHRKISSIEKLFEESSDEEASPAAALDCSDKQNVRQDLEDNVAGPEQPFGLRSSIDYLLEVSADGEDAEADQPHKNDIAQDERVEEGAVETSTLVEGDQPLLGEATPRSTPNYTVNADWSSTEFSTFPPRGPVELYQVVTEQATKTEPADADDDHQIEKRQDGDKTLEKSGEQSEASQTISRAPEHFDTTTGIDASESPATVSPEHAPHMPQIQQSYLPHSQFFTESVDGNSDADDVDLEHGENTREDEFANVNHVENVQSHAGGAESTDLNYDPLQTLFYPTRAEPNTGPEDPLEMSRSSEDEPPDDKVDALSYGNLGDNEGEELSDNASDFNEIEVVGDDEITGDYSDTDSQDDGDQEPSDNASEFDETEPVGDDEITSDYSDAESQSDEAGEASDHSSEFDETEPVGDDEITGDDSDAESPDDEAEEPSDNASDFNEAEPVGNDEITGDYSDVDSQDDEVEETSNNTPEFDEAEPIGDDGITSDQSDSGSQDDGFHGLDEGALSEESTGFTNANKNDQSNAELEAVEQISSESTDTSPNGALTHAPADNTVAAALNSDESGSEQQNRDNDIQRQAKGSEFVMQPAETSSSEAEDVTESDDLVPSLSGPPVVDNASAIDALVESQMLHGCSLPQPAASGRTTPFHSLASNPLRPQPSENRATIPEVESVIESGSESVKNHLSYSMEATPPPPPRPAGAATRPSRKLYATNNIFISLCNSLMPLLITLVVLYYFLTPVEYCDRSWASQSSGCQSMKTVGIYANVSTDMYQRASDKNYEAMVEGLRETLDQYRREDQKKLKDLVKVEPLLVPNPEIKPVNMHELFVKTGTQLLHLKLATQDMRLSSEAIDVTSKQCEKVVNRLANEMRDSESDGLYSFDMHLEVVEYMNLFVKVKESPNPARAFRWYLMYFEKFFRGHVDPMLKEMEAIDTPRGEQGPLTRWRYKMCLTLPYQTRMCHLPPRNRKQIALLKFASAISSHVEFLLGLADRADSWFPSALEPIQGIVTSPATFGLVSAKQLTTFDTGTWYLSHYRVMQEAEGNPRRITQNSLPYAAGVACLSTYGLLRDTRSLMQTARTHLLNMQQSTSVLIKELQSSEGATKLDRAWHTFLANQHIQTVLQDVGSETPSRLYTMFQLAAEGWQGDSGLLVNRTSTTSESQESAKASTTA